MRGEDPVDPRRLIVDAHPHLYGADHKRYLLDDVIADTRTGHNVTDTVFVEAGTTYRGDGPETLRPVGETEFAPEQARASEPRATRIAAIVAFADLGLGEAVDDVVQAHAEAAGGRLRGVRHATAWDPSSEVPVGHTHPPRGLMADASFRRGVAWLGESGYSFDAWLYHPQLGDLMDLARAAEGTTIVLDHLGGPLNVGPYRDRDAVRLEWRSGMLQLADVRERRGQTRRHRHGQALLRHRVVIPDAPTGLGRGRRLVGRRHSLVH